MNLLSWLDVSLMMLGLLTTSLRLWNAVRRRRTACCSALDRGMKSAAPLLFYFGLSALTAAGIDVGMAEWDRAYRSSSQDNSIQEMMTDLNQQFSKLGILNSKDDNIREMMMAPDFALPALDEDRTVRLSDYRGHKPVVLVFGSFG